MRLETKKGNYIGFVPDTIKAFEKCGMKYYNEGIYLQGMAGACLTAGRVMGISQKLKRYIKTYLYLKNTNAFEKGKAAGLFLFFVPITYKLNYKD